MPWADHQAAHAAEILTEFGGALTPCTESGYATGSALTGVFRKRGDVAMSPWAAASPGYQLSDQRNPYALLLAADAATIERNSYLTPDDGVTVYRITRIHPADNDGWVRIDLAETAP